MGFRRVARSRPGSLGFNIILAPMRTAMLLANNKGTDKRAHPRRLVSALVIGYMKSKETRADISSFSFVVGFSMIKSLAMPLVDLCSVIDHNSCIGKPVLCWLQTFALSESFSWFHS